jgi:hypothetical protein
MWKEELCEQGPCRFGRSAVVEGGITGVGPGSEKEERAGISQHSCWPKGAPALDDLPRAGVAAASWRLRLLRPDSDHRARRFRDGYRSPALRTRSAADPG